jgi:hypothetical protein
MSAPQLKVHFDLSPSPPAYSPPPAYAAHSFGEHDMSFAQKEHLASMAEQKLGYLVSSKRREPSLRRVLLHAGFLERILDSIDAHVPDQYEDEAMIEESATVIEQTPSYDLSQSLTTIAEVDEMEIDEEEHDDEEEEESEDEDMPPLQRTISHRPGSPSLSDEEDILSESDSEDDLPSPPPTYNTFPDHPLFNLFEVREKARRDELSNHYKIDHNNQNNLFLVTNNLAVAA